VAPHVGALDRYPQSPEVAAVPSGAERDPRQVVAVIGLEQRLVDRDDRGPPAAQPADQLRLGGGDRGDRAEELEVHRPDVDDDPDVGLGDRGEVDDLGDVELPFTSAHMARNGMAALAAARAVGVEPHGRIDVSLSARRGQRIELPGPLLVLDDCYNANPMSMRAALDELAATAGGRRVAVLGDMLELGPSEQRFHEEIGAHARERGVELLVTVGPRAAHMAGAFGGATRRVADAEAAASLVTGLVRPGDTVLVKASRGVGLEVVTEALRQHG
jgi:UDP-N-acetylmuramyl pentapeptide synthase